MPALATNEAAEQLALVIDNAKPALLREAYSEIFPEKPIPADLSGTELGRLVRGGLEAEELVSLWNVVFPGDRNVWYNEEDQKIHHNEETFGYAEVE